MPKSNFAKLKNMINYHIKANKLDVEEVVSFFATTICLHLAEETHGEELFKEIIEGMKRLYNEEMKKKHERS